MDADAHTHAHSDTDSDINGDGDANVYTDRRANIIGGGGNDGCQCAGCRCSDGQCASVVGYDIKRNIAVVHRRGLGAHRPRHPYRLGMADD